jgi:hypothetical protein
VHGYREKELDRADPSSLEVMITTKSKCWEGFVRIQVQCVEAFMSKDMCIEAPESRTHLGSFSYSIPSRVSIEGIKALWAS